MNFQFCTYCIPNVRRIHRAQHYDLHHDHFHGSHRKLFHRFHDDGGRDGDVSSLNKTECIVKNTCKSVERFCAREH